MNKVKREIFWLFLVIIALLMLYGYSAAQYYAHVRGWQAALVSNMGELRQILREYKIENESIPVTLDELNIVGDSILRDPFTGKDLIYTPEHYSATNLVPLIYQEDYYRTQLWPFGKYKKYAIMSNLGVIRPVYKKDEEK